MNDKSNLKIPYGYPIVIFGCGAWGKMIFRYLIMNGYRVEAFCDNNSAVWGHMIHGTCVYDPATCVERFEESTFVIACKNNSDVIRKQLLELNVREKYVKLLDENMITCIKGGFFRRLLNETYEVDNTFKVENGYQGIVKKNDQQNRHYRILCDDKLMDKWFLSESKDDFDYQSEFEKYYGSYCVIPGFKNVNGKKNSIQILMACCHKDKDIRDNEECFWMRPIQCGKALTDIQLCELTDDFGENISEKNGNYCECTALYWAWKNEWAKESDYIGLRHYRRKLAISIEQLQDLSANGIDIVLMEPTYVESFADHFNKGAAGTLDWDILRLAIKEVKPDYYESFLRFEKQHMICQCNMFVMRRKLFDEYCEYLFAILRWIDTFYSLRVERSDRYLGYLAESLTSLFAMHNKERLKLAFADMEILR